MGALKRYNYTTNQWEYITNNPSVASIIKSEEMTGVVDGVNKIFTTLQPFSSIDIYKNGVHMRPGASNDYTITGANQITFKNAPAVTSPVTTINASYATASTANVAGSNSIVWKETPVGLVNGANGLYTTSRPYVAGSLLAHINGSTQGSLIAETNPALGTFTISPAPLTGDNIQTTYQYASSVSGNADTVDGIHAAPLGAPVGGQLYPLTQDAKFPVSLLVNAVKISATRTAASNTGNNAWQKVALDVELFDTNSNYDNVTNYRFVAPVSGYYQMNSHISTGSAVTTFLSAFFKNGLEYRRGSKTQVASSGSGSIANDFSYLNAGDYIELFVFASAVVPIETAAGAPPVMSIYMTSTA